MRRVTTVDSLYEIDDEDCLIRRVRGINEPTDRQGADGVWKSYAALTKMEDGLLIIWGNNDNGTARCTWTSPIIEEN